MSLVDVDVVEQILVHEIAIALVVGAVQADVFVEVIGIHIGEVQLLRVAAARELLIHGHGRGAGGQTQHGLLLALHHVGDNVRRGHSRILRMIENTNLHENILLFVCN